MAIRRIIFSCIVSCAALGCAPFALPAEGAEMMIAAAFRPWLRFETMLFCTLEKCFIVYLFLSNLGQPWSKGYLGAAIVDGTIAAYGILYFLSDQGRPARWIKDEG
jgi:hypothetical protein